jgi:hypothetical protein
MARRVCRRADQQLCKQYKLIGWVSKVNGRRQAYFSWCDRAIQELEAIGGAPPDDDSVVITIMGVLRADDSFETHCDDRGGTFLTDDDNWLKLYRAAAAAILEEYLNARELGSWP